MNINSSASAADSSLLRYTLFRVLPLHYWIGIINPCISVCLLVFLIFIEHCYLPSDITWQVIENLHDRTIISIFLRWFPLNPVSYTYCLEIFFLSLTLVRHVSCVNTKLNTRFFFASVNSFTCSQYSYGLSVYILFTISAYSA